MILSVTATASRTFLYARDFRQTCAGANWLALPHANCGRGHQVYDGEVRLATEVT
jgi:hypothetical protein